MNRHARNAITRNAYVPHQDVDLQSLLLLKLGKENRIYVKHALNTALNTPEQSMRELIRVVLVPCF